MKYLLTFSEKNDKSKFILGLGYSIDDMRELFIDICINTSFSSMEFSKFSFGELLVKAKTVLKIRMSQQFGE